MLRNELEAMMKARGLKSMIVVLRESDPLGVRAELKGGIAYDSYTGRRIDRKIDIWGYITYERGMPVRHPFKV